MKTLAAISAVLCVTVIAAIAAPRATTPAYQGLSGNDGWGAQALAPRSPCRRARPDNLALPLLGCFACGSP